MLFDDQTARPGSRARAVEYALDLDARTATLVWQRETSDGNVTGCCGSARREDNGSTVIGWGPLPTMFSDIGPSGALTLAVSQLPSGFAYRVVKEPVTAFDRATLRALAGR
jgi:hypothetical protein